MSAIKLVVNVPENAQTVSDTVLIQSGDPSASIHRLGGWLQMIPAKSGSVRVELGAVQASGNITFTGLPTATETCSINGVTFTARASGAVANEFNIAGTAAGTATNLAAAINASVTTGIINVVSASANGGVVTITAVEPGLEGNSLGAISDSLTNATSTSWAGGSDGTRTTLAVGY